MYRVPLLIENNFGCRNYFYYSMVFLLRKTPIIDFIFFSQGKKCDPSPSVSLTAFFVTTYI